LIVFIAHVVVPEEGKAFPPCPDAAFKMWTECTGTRTDLFGNSYVGEFKDGQFHGQGTLSGSDGSVQKGTWRKGRFQDGETIPSGSKESGDNKYEADSLYTAGSGTGFSITSSGHIVTNMHVIKDCDEVELSYKGKEITLQHVFSDPNNDLALLKGSFKPGKAFRLSRNDPKLMEEIFVAGYPFGDTYSSPVKVTKGVISSVVGYENNLSEFQFDAAINVGNSGGPIFNSKGNILGVTVAGLDDIKVLKKTGDIPQNANFGIKSSVVSNLFESNSIRLGQPNHGVISRSKLRHMVKSATYYLQCYKTGKRINKEAKNN